MNSSVVTKTSKYDSPLRMNGINAKYSTGSLMGTEEQMDTQVLLLLPINLKLDIKQ